jgi:hypothetical protein
VSGRPRTNSAVRTTTCATSEEVCGQSEDAGMRAAACPRPRRHCLRNSTLASKPLRRRNPSSYRLVRAPTDRGVVSQEKVYERL